ncbi:SusC/RagA family TonB-linked outer membrane protein [Ferruginibacter sp.]|nr:SusC/RagA family TonB-linked outer membrane protein [Ferruginibacter sp.]
MKLTTVFLIAACLQVSASGYSQKVTLNQTNVSLQKVFEEIKKQTGYHFFYADEVLVTAKNVTVSTKKASVKEVLDICFKDQQLAYTISENTIVVKRSINKTEEEVTVMPEPASFEIKGKVTDAKGEPVLGANIINERTKKGATTDANGFFTIQAEKNDMLTFSYVGKGSQTVKVVDINTILNISLADAVVINETIVVTALGIKREEKALGYSVQKISGESIQKVSGLDVATSLTGKVAGVLVRNSPDFAAVPVVTVRGESAILVVDGIPYAYKTLADMSSEDIESISILKGATASALYGYRGANGAILVTTKNGSSNKSGISVDFTTNTMFTAGFLAIPEKQNVYGRGSAGTYDLYSENSWGTFMDGTMRDQWDPVTKTFVSKPYLPLGKDNYKNFLEQGYVTNNNLSVGFRKDNVSIRNSLNWAQNKGRYPNSTIDKYTYTLGADFTVNKLKISTNVSYAVKKSPNVGSNGYTSYDPMYSILIWSPNDFDLSLYKDNYWYRKGEIQNTNFGYYPDLPLSQQYKGKNINNPYFDMYEKTNEISRNIFNADITTSYQFTPWLKATVQSGIDFFKERGELRSSWGSYLSSGNSSVPGAANSGWNGGIKGQYNIGISSGFSTNNDLLLSGDKKFNKFQIEYLAGGTILYAMLDNMNASTQGGISVPGFFSIKASVNAAQVSQSIRARQVNSIYGRAAISWNKMAFIEATGRNDWSSTLAKDQRSYFYPSVSGSFIASELLPDTKKWLDMLKLRGSWTLSKDVPNIYDINSSYSYAAATWGAFNGAGVPSSLYSPSIRPSSAETYEQGLQAIFLKNRAMIDVSHYTKRFFDRITTVGITGASGYSGILTNWDEEITRRGWEIILNGTPVKNKDWQLDLSFNWSTFASYYTKLDSLYTAVRPWVQVGRRTDHYVSRDFQRDPGGNIIHNSSGVPITYGYNQLFGYSDPKFIWGTSANLKYKNFSLFLSFDGVTGGITNTRTESYMWQAGVHPNSVSKERDLDIIAAGIYAAAGGGPAGLAAVAAAGKTLTNYVGQGVVVVSGSATYDAVGNIVTDTRVYGKNTTATTYKQYMIALHNSSAWGGAGSIDDTYSKTFFKLREISLSYNIPAKYLHKIAKAASISLIGQNVLLKAKDFKYSDPDGGNEDFADPSTRYLGAKISFTF